MKRFVALLLTFGMICSMGITPVGCGKKEEKKTTTTTTTTPGASTTEKKTETETKKP